MTTLAEVKRALSRVGRAPDRVETREGRVRVLRIRGKRDMREATLHFDEAGKLTLVQRGGRIAEDELLVAVDETSPADLIARECVAFTRGPRASASSLTH